MTTSTAISDQLFRAVTSGNIRHLERLLSQGANPNARSARWAYRRSSLLHLATEAIGTENAAEIGLLLLTHGADPAARRHFNFPDETPFATFGHHLPDRPLSKLERGFLVKLARAHYEYVNTVLLETEGYQQNFDFLIATIEKGAN